MKTHGGVAGVYWIGTMSSSRSDSLYVATGEPSPNLVYYKICLAGDIGVGKTALYRRIKTGEFIECNNSTLKSDAHRFTHVVDGVEVPVSVSLSYYNQC